MEIESLDADDWGSKPRECVKYCAIGGVDSVWRGVSQSHRNSFHFYSYEHRRHGWWNPLAHSVRAMDIYLTFRRHFKRKLFSASFPRDRLFCSVPVIIHCDSVTLISSKIIVVIIMITRFLTITWFSVKTNNDNNGRETTLHADLTEMIFFDDSIQKSFVQLPIQFVLHTTSRRSRLE